MKCDKPERAPKFLQYVARVIRAYLEDDFLICPNCGQNLVDPWNKAGTQFGICDICYFKLKTKAEEQAYAYLLAEDQYDAIRQKRHRKQTGKVKHGNT